MRVSPQSAGFAAARRACARLRTPAPAGARPRTRVGTLTLSALALAAAVKAGLVLAEVVSPAPVETLSPPEPLAVVDAGPADLPMTLEPAAGPDGSDGEDDSEPGELTTSLLQGRLLTPPQGLSAGEIQVLEDLAVRRRAVEEQERQLDLRRAVVETAEMRLRQRLAQLEELKTAIEEMLKQHEAEEENKIARLVKIYETMKPKAAAEIFNRLEMSVLIRVVSRMREAKSSDILGRMDPVRAREVTAELARQRGLPTIAEGRS